MKVICVKNSILQSCTYILATELSNDVYLVDCGDVPPIKEYIIKNNKNIKGIFLTHSHFDHIYGICDIVESFPECIIYCSEQTYDGINDERINMSYIYLDEDFIPPKRRHFVFVNASTNNIKCCDQNVTIFETPGHDVDCLCFSIGKYIFTGDVYNPNFPVFTNWRRSDKIVAVENEKRIKDYSERNKLIICPGHFK